MDININQGNAGNFGIGRNLAQAGDVADAAADAAHASLHSANVTVTTMQPPKLPSAEPSVGEIPDSAFLRDDDLGKLVSSAFSLAPPPMPKFE